jgi:deoxycytidine triphosphate deaminase
MSSLNDNIIKELCSAGWKCNDFSNLCKIKEHKGKTNKLVYYPNDINKEIEIRGNSVVIHIGDIFSELETQNEDKIIIPPGKFIFFTTKEVVNMPMDIDGNLYMNPTYSNMGLLFFTLGHVDPGYHGILQGGILNMTSESKIINRNADCLYLSFNRLEKPNKPYMKYHRTPRLELDEVQKNLIYSSSPGFALTKSDFVTRSELHTWLTILAAIIFGLFSIIITIILNQTN